jgi:hypothetical protein
VKAFHFGHYKIAGKKPSGKQIAMGPFDDRTEHSQYWSIFIGNAKAKRQ